MGRLYQRFLRQAIRGGVEWMPGTLYAGSAKLKDELIVRLDRPSPSRWVRARYLVGPDGATSRVGDALGLDVNREWIVGVEVVLEGVPLEAPPRFHCCLDPRFAPGYLACVVQHSEEVAPGLS